MQIQPLKDFMHAWLVDVLHRVGPRESCSEAEKKAGRIVADAFREVCERVIIEPFTCHPRAFMGVFPLLPLFYIQGIVLYFWFPVLAWLPVLVGTLLIFLEVFKYKEVADRFFPKAEGENVVGILKPNGEAKRRVIVCAHLDSAYEFSWFYLLKDLAMPTGMAGLVGVVFMLGLTLVRAAGEVFGFGDPAVFHTLGWVGAAFYPIVGLLFFWQTHAPVPGAMDDLAGVAVLVGLARNLGELKKGGEYPLENTELVLLASSSEEAGLRGAKRFVERHQENLRKIPTYAVILDGIYDERYLTLVSWEFFTGTRPDIGLVSAAQEVARELGRKIEAIPMMLGATDASAFIQAGIPSISLVLSDTQILPMQYHTRFDTPDRVRPESMQVTLEMVAGILAKADAA